MPRVSVLMPVYNEEKYLKESIESILSQTFGDFELIIWDDASDDKSPSIIADYSKIDERIKTFLVENRMGFTNSLNNLLKKSKGEYICIIGADDIYRKKMLEFSVKTLDENKNIGGTYSDYSWIDSNGNIIRDIKCMEFDINLLLRAEYINLMSMMVRRSCLKKIGDFDNELKMSQDSLMKLEIGYQFGLKRIPENLIKYRIREGSITTSHEKEQQDYLGLAKRKFINNHPEFRDFKVTVGVPIYNSNLDMLKKCLQSIKEQTYDNYEVVVIDDGSENNKELERMVSGFGFKYFYQENKGIGGARNAIIDHMAEDSDYLCYLSHDDMYTPDYLITMANYAKQNPNAILFSDWLIINDNDDTIREFNAPTFRFYEDMCIAILSSAERNTMFTNLSTTFIPSKIIRENKFLDELRFGEDLEWVLRTALVKKIKYTHIQIPLIKYRLHLGSMTSKKINEIVENNIKIMKGIKEMLKW